MCNFNVCRCTRIDHEENKIIRKEGHTGKFGVISDPRLLDFGMVCLNTSASKALKIKNCQNEQVLVKLHSDDYQVTIKGDTSHAISPHGSHDFEISVSPQSSGVFRG